ncbi:MAG: hypothetical protein ACRDMH_17640 [Solirubrobacterales bacterium]
MASSVDRVDYRNAIVAFGRDALLALRELAEEPDLGPFAIRTIRKIGDSGEANEAAQTLRSIDRKQLTHSAVADLDEALQALEQRRPRPWRKATTTGNRVFGELVAGLKYKRYDDHWIGNDRLQFFGEWSGPGDMTMTAGNAMIVERSPELWVFIESGGLQEFQGVFAYESHRSLPMSRDGKPATAIVFTLLKVKDCVEL